MADEDEEVKVKEGSMAAGVEGVIEIAESYGESVTAIKAASDLTAQAFEDVDGSPRSNFEQYLEAMWGCLADSQDGMNRAAEELAKYTEDMFDVDGSNADVLDKAGKLEQGEQPKGDG